MKLLALCATGLSLMLSFTSCTNNKHLISDAAERNAVQQDFETRRSKLSHGDLFQVFEQPMSDEQRGSSDLPICLYAIGGYYGLFR